MLRRAAYRLALLLVGTGALSVLWGCSRCSGKSENPPIDAGSPAALSLSPEKAKQVLATVGSATITLGDFAASLERMDRYERLRYQSEERRKRLLDEIVSLDLLADEAVRRKLEKDPRVQLQLDEALRDELLRDLRRKIPSPDRLPAPEVRAYYDAHREEFSEPERRRVSAIVLSSEAEARGLVASARQADARTWGELVLKHSILRPPPGEQTPVELAGDLGIVSAPGQTKGAGSDVPEPVVRAVFAIDKVGEVYGEPVRAKGRIYIVRLAGRTAARTRTFEEAERSIRVRLVERRVDAAERQLIEQLKERYPVTIDQAKLAKIKVEAPDASPNLRQDLQR